MVGGRCGQRIYRSMRPRRLLLVIASLSVTATITFFIYSMTLDDQANSNTRSIQSLRFQARPKHGDAGAILDPDFHAERKRPGSGRKTGAGDQGVEKMSWPDKKKVGRGGGRRPHSKRKNLRRGNFSGLADPLAVPRMAEYCNLPIRELHGREGEALPGYSLQSVYVVIRHGDRSPMTGFNNKPNPILNCEYNPARTFDIPNYDGFVPHLQHYASRLHPDNSFPFALYPRSQTCGSAQLTGNGASQHLLNGWHLHQRYIQKWRLFSQPFSPDQVYAKSTGYSRTYQSAISLLYTFLPTLNLTELNIFRIDNVYFCSDMSLGFKCACPALKRLKKQSDDEAGIVDRNSSNLARVRQHIARVFNMKTSQLPWIWGMVDWLMAYVCHKIPLPCSGDRRCVEPAHVAELWNQLDMHEARLERIEAYQKYAHLSVHPLLHEISQHMIVTTKRKAKVKFVLYSGHDSTISPLASALGIGRGRWPKYATRLVFELYSRDEPKKHHFLRILLNGEDVTSKVVFCKGQARNGFCKLKYFIDFVHKENLKLFNGRSYAQACGFT